MIDIKILRSQPEIYKENMKKRFKDPRLIDRVLELDSKWRELKVNGDKLRSERNKISEKINKEKKLGNKDVSDLIEKARITLASLERTENEEKKTYEMLQKELQKIPNLIHNSVPIGRDSRENVIIREWGKVSKPRFDIINHAELLEQLNLADFEAGRKNAGYSFNYLIGDIALLDYALQRYGMDFITKKGFTPIIPPLLLNFETIFSVLNGLEDFENMIYKIENENLYLIGTGEHPLVSLFKDKTLNKKSLPIKLCTLTPCFRKEIGSHGLDTKGLFRMHQFNKVEQVIFCCEEESYNALEEMQRIAEEFFKTLEIPFRVVEICSGDLGNKFSKQYDIEAWFPRQRKYAEVTSAGNCTDFQSRALNTKYIDGQEKKYVHILNSTVVATSRAMVAIIENYQQKDGSIKIPKVLWKYMGGKRVIQKRAV
ncbi:MAG: serine--tRNA ligase [Candidatus Pacearchaeota archaeon]